MQWDFMGSHPAMDFLNTVYSPAGTPVETIGDGGLFLEWLVAADLLDASAAAKLKKRAGLEALDTAAAEARKLRKWMSEWIARWSEQPGADYSAELRRLNALLERATHYREVVAADHGLHLHEHYRIDTPDQLISLVASQLAALITSEQPELVKHCAGAACTIWFLDRTKAHARRFCSAASCGNRAKVAAFRERQRGA
jgi:predicted RNA-binding Zn ribbon-like protein